MQETSGSRMPPHYAVAVFAGNGLEFYDFITYAFFAVYIGRTFFPSSDSMLSLLALRAHSVSVFLRDCSGPCISGRWPTASAASPSWWTFHADGLLVHRDRV